MKVKIVLIVLAFALLLTFSYYIQDKPSIHEATYDDLVNINGIGDILANRVLSYLSYNEYIEIQDLTDIPGIGEGKIDLIRRYYDD